MKVLFINTVFGKGSTGKLVKLLGDAVEENGGDYKVAYGRGVLDQQHGIMVGNKLDMYYHALMTRITGKSGFYSRRATRNLVDQIKSYNPDIIHLHNLHGYYVNIPILFDYLKNQFKGKTVWTIHDCWPFTGHCVYYNPANCYKWQTECHDCPLKSTYPSSYCIDSSREMFHAKKDAFIGLRNTTVITVSDWLKGEVEQSFLSQYPIERIYNGIDLTKFKSSSNKHKGEKKEILLVSDGWSEGKGFYTFLEVAKVAPSDWHFSIVGVDKKQKSLLPNNVTGYEKIWDQSELVRMYSNADVFFNPSRYETFGLVTIEAIACGTPVVVFNVTACPEIVKHTNSGIVISENSSPYEMVQAVEKAMMIEIPVNALDIFTKETFKEQYLRIYHE